MLQPHPLLQYPYLLQQQLPLLHQLRYLVLLHRPLQLLQGVLGLEQEVLVLFEGGLEMEEFVLFLLELSSQVHAGLDQFGLLCVGFVCFFEFLKEFLVLILKLGYLQFLLIDDRLQFLELEQEFLEVTGGVSLSPGALGFQGGSFPFIFIYPSFYEETQLRLLLGVFQGGVGRGTVVDDRGDEPHVDVQVGVGEGEGRETELPLGFAVESGGGGLAFLGALEPGFPGRGELYFPHPGVHELGRRYPHFQLLTPSLQSILSRLTLSFQFENIRNIQMQNLVSPTHPRSHQLTKITTILSSLQTRDNSAPLRSLQELILSLCSEKQMEGGQECSYYLDLVEIDREVERLRGELEGIVRKSGDKRVVSFGNSFEEFVRKVFSLAPTSMHMYSTRMKQHLLEEIQFERERRVRAEMELSEILEMIEQNEELREYKQRREMARGDGKERKYGEIRNSVKGCGQCPVKDIEIGQLVEGIRKLESIIDAQKQANKDLKLNLKNLQKERDRLKQNSIHSPRTTDLTLQLQSLQKQNSQLRTDISRFNQIITNLNQKLSYAKGELSKINRQNQQNNNLSTAIQDLEDQNRELKDDLASTRKKMSVLESEKRGVEERSRSLGKRLKEKERDMENMIESYERKVEMSENFPSRMTYDPITERMCGTSSAFRLRDMNKNDLSPTDYYHNTSGNQLMVPSGLKKSARKEQPLDTDNDELLRMILIQACSLQKFLSQDLHELLLQQ